VAKQAGGQVHGHKIGTTATHGGNVYVADVGVIGLPSDTRHPRADIDVTTARCCQDARLKAQGGVVVASGVIERATPDGRVFVACRVGKERGTTDGDVEVAGVMKKRLVTNCRVFEPANVRKERLLTDGRVRRARIVKNKRVSSDGRVPRGGGVEQQRSSAHCGIGIRVVEGQRSSANTGVVATGNVQKERIPANSCVASASGEEMKGITSFRCREPGIAPVRRRSNLRSCLYLGQQREAAKHRQDRCEYCEATAISH
jgi:hypothetical protein